MKSGAKSGRFGKGKDPRRGKGPVKGTGGRPPDEFKAFPAGLRDHPRFRARLQGLIEADENTFVKFAQWLLDRTDGRPLQPISTSGGLVVTLRSVRE